MQKQTSAKGSQKARRTPQRATRKAVPLISSSEGNPLDSQFSLRWLIKGQLMPRAARLRASGVIWEATAIENFANQLLDEIEAIQQSTNVIPFPVNR